MCAEKLLDFVRRISGSHIEVKKKKKPSSV